MSSGHDDFDAHFGARVRELLADIERKEHLKGWRPFLDDIRAAPRVLEAITAISKNDSCSEWCRALALRVLRYYLAENDYLPDDALGGIGYIDDIVLGAYAITLMMKGGDRQQCASLVDAPLVGRCRRLAGAGGQILGKGMWERVRGVADSGLEARG
jgi:uncharacterized membrane protein YkvA (DUF1232 family)